MLAIAARIVKQDHLPACLRIVIREPRQGPLNDQRGIGLLPIIRVDPKADRQIALFLSRKDGGHFARR